MKHREDGVVYKASPRAFLGNYILAAGVLVFWFLAVRAFGLEFSLSPVGQEQIAGTVAHVAFLAVAVYLAAESFIEGWIRRYVITNQDIVMVEGILWKRRLSIPYQSVAEVRVVRGIFGRLFNYGTVEITGFKESEIVMGHITDPEGIQRLLQNKINLGRRAGKKENKARFTEE